MIAISGCSHSPDRNDDNEEKGVITSTWNNDSNSWNHYQRYNGMDHYLYSGHTPYEGNEVRGLFSACISLAIMFIVTAVIF